jgi:hypothetical protein
MNLSFYLPESFTTNKYVKIEGKSVYQSVQVSVDANIINKCNKLLLLIRKKQFFGTTNKYVNISSEELKATIGNDYKGIVDLLVNSNIIGGNDIFSAKKFSKSYCIHESANHAVLNHYNSGLYEQTGLLDIDKDNTGCTSKQASSFRDIQEYGISPMGYPICRTTALLVQPFWGYWIHIFNPFEASTKRFARTTGIEGQY